MTQVRIGQVVHAVVPRSTNGGQDHAPAIVTRHAGGGRFDLTVLRADGSVRSMLNAQVLADRAAADDAMRYHYGDLPGHRSKQGDGPDDPPVHIPGTNTLTGEPWHRSDVAHWVPLAYLPDDKPVEVPTQVRAVPLEDDAPPPAPVVVERVETRAEKETRLRAELAALGAED